jgi:hypothetical protein
MRLGASATALPLKRHAHSLCKQQQKQQQQQQQRAEAWLGCVQHVGGWWAMCGRSVKRQKWSQLMHMWHSA